MDIQRHRPAPDDALDDYYGTILPWFDQALADRGDLGWWRRQAEKLEPARVLELGCGTGRVTEILAGDGRTVVGLDRVPAMLQRARARLGGARNVHLVRGDLRALPLRSGWDLIVVADDPFIHLRRDRDRSRALTSAATLLAPGGHLMLDLLWWTPEEVERARSDDGLHKIREATIPGGTLVVEERWTVARDRRSVMAAYRYRPPVGPPVAASFEGRRWTLPELRRRLVRAGLQIVRLRGGYDDRPFQPDEAETLLVDARGVASGPAGSRARVQGAGAVATREHRIHRAEDRRQIRTPIFSGRSDSPTPATGTSTGHRGGAMSDLATRTCTPCTGDTPTLEGEDLEEMRKKVHRRWEVVDEHHLGCSISFDDFREALDFTNRVGEVAEEEGHHPEICLGWGEARLKIWTHAIDGLSENDFILAAKIDRLLE